MKRILSFLLAMLLLLSVSRGAAAETVETTQPNQVPAQAPTEAPGPEPTQPVTEAPTVPSTEVPQDPTVPSTQPQEPTHPEEEPTAPSADQEVCQHSWMYVEVDPTCTEYGARGYVCIYCEAITEAEAIDLAPHTYDHSCDAFCNYCGAERSVSHKISSTWSRNSTEHWHTCSVCGEKADVGKHYPGPAATEEKAQYCLTCGLMMMPKKAHTHTYAETYSSDETGHWYACSGCTERKGFELHSYDGPCDPDCRLCGYVSEKNHDFSQCSFDAEGHWNICSLCGIAEEPQPHVLSENPEEEGAQICIICGCEILAPTHVHQAEEPWFRDETDHWQLCQCGEKMHVQPHIWEEAQAPTYRCTVCGAEKLEELKEETGFSWWIPAVIFLLGTSAVGLTVLIFLRKRSRNQ